MITDSQTITWVVMDTRATDNYVYKDMGAAYFSGDFIHSFKHNVTPASNGSYSFPWAITNDLNDLAGIDVASGDFQAVGIYYDGANRYVRIAICENGALNETGLSYAIAAGTDYYYTIVRDDDAGANNTGQLTLYVCTENYYGEAGTSLVHTITGDCGAGEQNDFRYINATQVYNTGVADYASGTVEDLDLASTISPATGGQVIIIQEF